MLSGLFGKYRAVVISVAMFIFLDAGVLVLNFYISSQLADDAKNVNLAGRQRMLSQKITKSALVYRNSVQTGLPDDVAYRELTSAVTLFDDTLSAFKSGGNTKDGTGSPTFLNAATSDASVVAIDSAIKIWQPLKADINKLKSEVSSGNQPGLLMDRITAYAQANNLQLLKLMNNLTNELEGIARNKSETLRLIQAGAITLAILNFFLILFHFIGQLRRSDSMAEEAREETTEILKTVREGLLLLDDKMTIGTQYSESIKDIFGDQEFSGMSFRDLLKSLVIESDMQTAEEYIKLLLNGTVKESLVGSLNPLSDLEVSLPDGSGGFRVKHLSFRFNRTIQDGEIRHILVTVLDVTELNALRAELEKANQAQGQGVDFGSLKELLHIEKSSMEHFLTETNSGLVAVNDILKQKASNQTDYADKINSSFRIIHRIKGDASALDLPMIVQAAHDFEDQLKQLGELENIQGGDFLPLTLSLNEFFKLLNDMRELFTLFSSMAPGNVAAVKQSQTEAPAPAPVAANSLDQKILNSLVERIAKEEGKQCKLTFELEAFNEIPVGHRKLVQDSIIQLIRNSVVHGIEVPELRQAAGKSTTGTIRVAVTRQDDRILVSVKDDGQGIDPAAIKRRALEKGLYSEEILESMQPMRLISMIFEPGFSTHEGVSEHAGRGVGMDLVKACVQELSGRVRIANKPTKYCDISFSLPVSHEQAA
ncbi:MAG: ATP-binding protein [Oceanobacter sp.]